MPNPDMLKVKHCSCGSILFLQGGINCFSCASCGKTLEDIPERQPLLLKGGGIWGAGLFSREFVDRLGEKYKTVCDKYLLLTMQTEVQERTLRLALDRARAAEARIKDLLGT